MTAQTSKTIYRMLPLLAGAGLLAAATGTSMANASSGPLRCEIVASTTNGMTRLEGVAHAGHSMHGSYLFRISGSGANITQGGDFDARAGESATLGSVTLGGNNRYDVRLEVKANNGAAVSCAQRI